MQIIGLAGQARTGKSEIVKYLVEDFGFVRYAFADPLYEEIKKAYNLPVDSTLLTGGSKELSMYIFALEECSDRGFVEIALGMGKSMTQPLSPRWVLQVWGTEYRRAQNKDYWLEKADLFIEAFLETLKYKDTEEDTDRKMRVIEALELSKADYDTAVNQLLETNHTYIREHPGIVVDGTRFHNEVEWIKSLGGAIWHVNRADRPDTAGVMSHESTQQLPLETGDKLILNTGTLADLRTGVVLALRGNDIVNTKAAE